MVQMNANELADAMETRASIRRKATSRKSVQENANDRLADQLDQAATMLRQQEVEIERITSKYEEMLSQQQAEIEALNQRIERMIENASHHEGIAHAGGFETGYQAGLRKAKEK
jgi:flagellar biosynthesis/type III secretory pathway protein FliH